MAIHLSVFNLIIMTAYLYFHFIFAQTLPLLLEKCRKYLSTLHVEAAKLLFLVKMGMHSFYVE